MSDSSGGNQHVDATGSLIHISSSVSILSNAGSRDLVVLFICNDDTVSPAILMESADLKIVDTVDEDKP